MKAFNVVLLSTLAICFLATSVAAFLKCYVCTSSSTTDPYCTDTDLGVPTEGCKTCVTHLVAKGRYRRECSDELQKESCRVLPGTKQACYCRSDLCNVDARFDPLVTCHVCESTSVSDPRCSDTDLGKPEGACATCAMHQLGGKRFKRECLKVYKKKNCEVKKGRQVCMCNSDLCNAEVIFKPLIKCHKCTYDPVTKYECTDNNVGEKVGGCISCSSTKLNGRSEFIRDCSFSFEKDIRVMVTDAIQVSVCNTDLCNGFDIFEDVITCYECNGENKNSTTCTDTIFGEEKGGCLSCSYAKLKDNVFHRLCEKEYKKPGCFKERANTCFCDQGLCNVEDVYLPVMKCYVCEPTSATSCNVRNSGIVQGGCLTCRTTLHNGKTTRQCSDHALEPGRIIDKVKTHILCNTDLCNGDGEDSVDGGGSSNSTSRGLQKTVSGRVLIGGAVAAMLGLARHS